MMLKTLAVESLAKSYHLNCDKIDRKNNKFTLLFEYQKLKSSYYKLAKTLNILNNELDDAIFDIAVEKAVEEYNKAR